MAGNIYLTFRNGDLTEVAATQSSTGIANADQIVALDAQGQLDSSLFPAQSGFATQVFGEIPVGALDGLNLVFSLAHSFQINSTVVYRNGLRERLGVGYTESSPDITFTTAPLPSDVIEVDYLY